jgi:deazaflavin-dependent oxidoreductase (nitroreductase family)
MSYLDLADRIWPLFNRITRVHTLAYRATGGRIGRRVPGMGAPVLLLDHVGAKSAKRRTSPLLYVPDGDNVAIVASKGGFPKHPGWFHNLRANPETTVQVGSERRPVRARLATAEERKTLWKRAVELYPAYADYQERTEREIPVLVLEPR